MGGVAGAGGARGGAGVHAVGTCRHAGAQRLHAPPWPRLARAAPKTLVPALKKMPTKRGVHLHNLTADSLAFSLAFDNAPGAALRCAAGAPRCGLCACECDGVQA